MTNTLTLEANPEDAPGCVKLVGESGKSVLFQTDYDWPAVARNFGWTEHGLKPDKEPEFYSEDWQNDPELTFGESRIFAAYDKKCNCFHDSTDGTVNCKECGMTAMEFITSARHFLDENDGAECENPGYELE